MTHLRAVLRLLSLILLSTCILLVYVVGILPIWFSQKKRVQYRRILMGSWGRCAARIIGMNLTINGRPPSPPCCIVSNHLSYVDVLAFQAANGSILLSKKEVATWPIVGFASKLIGTLFIDRSNRRDVVRVTKEIHERLHWGESVVFFPEGTSSDGSHVLPFKSSLLNYFSEATYPVHFASIQYHSERFDVSTNICWWGEMLFLPHFWSLLTLHSFDCFLTFGENPVTISDRKELTNTLRESIINQLASKNTHHTHSQKSTSAP